MKKSRKITVNLVSDRFFVRRELCIMEKNNHKKGKLCMKKSVKKRVVLLWLLAAMLCSACGQKDAGTEPETTAETTAETVAESESETTREDVSDNLPEKDFDGREFRIVSYSYIADDYEAEEMNGSLVNDAIYNRNLAVEERFKIKLVADGSMDAGAAKALVTKSVQAGEDAMELSVNHMIEQANAATTGVFRDWNEIPYVDVTRTWWNKTAYENLSIAHKAYLMTGDISSWFLRGTYVVYFNKNRAEDAQLSPDTLFDIANDGKWTIDRYYDLVKDTWQDLNGDGKMDKEDYFGLAAQVTSYVTPFVYSLGEVTVGKDENDIPHLAMNTEKFSSMVEKVYALMYESNGTLTNNDWSTHSELFKAGRALFMNGVLVHSMSSFTEMEDDYGIIPYPKWDEAQQHYATMSDGSSPLCAIPKTVSDMEFVGLITEGMAAESWRQVTPAIYDVALKVRNVRDPKSLTAIELAASSAVIDFGFVYGNYNSMGFVMSELIGSKKNDFASYFAGRADKWEKSLADIAEAAIESDS